MNELLKQLTEAVGPPGDEAEIRTLIRDLIVDLVDEWRVDALGNILAVKKGTGKSDLCVMVDAHMDEVGVIIDEISSNGMLKFSNLGGISSLTLAGQVMQIGRKKVRGVIGLKPVHLLSSRERRKIPSSGSLYIDIGAKDKGTASGKVKVGDRGTFWSEYVEFGEDDDFGRTAVGKALDNRAACAVLIELLRKDRYPFDLHAAFTSQEEVGLRGAKVAAYAIKPDIGIVLECTPAYDLPNDLDISTNTALGQGPALYVMDSQTIQDPRLVQHIMKTGEANQIPYQIRRPGGGGTNTGSMQRADLGCFAATIGLPERYAHTASSMINLRDYENYIKLADATLRSLSRKTIERH